MQIRDPIINEHEDRFVFVRTGTGAEGYVQVRYVIPAPSSEGSKPVSVPPDQSREESKLSANVPAASTVGHFGEWRAVEERPIAGRYSSGGERLADINKYFGFVINAFYHNSASSAQY